MNRRLFVFLFLVFAPTIPACDRSTSEAQACISRHGPQANLSLEPRYDAGGRLHRWETNDGCPIRLDVLMTREGPTHCGWQDTTDIVMPADLGEVLADDYRIYERDPNNDLGNARISRAFDPDARLPANARRTRYRQGDQELWVVPRDPSFIYLKSPDGIERWPWNPSPPGCG